jgi:ferredoxin
VRLRVLIDEESCLGYGDCAEQAPGAFEVGDTARYLGGASDRALLDAARTCPAEAITLIDLETGEPVEL